MAAMFAVYREGPLVVFAMVTRWRLRSGNVGVKFKHKDANQKQTKSLAIKKSVLEPCGWWFRNRSKCDARSAFARGSFGLHLCALSCSTLVTIDSGIVE
eukprot:12248226-Ditylum_brightwellii.AAC.1